MEIEINASEYETPAQLAHEIRGKVSQLYVDWVWVKFAESRHKVTPNAAEHVCRGLAMAQLILDQIDAQGREDKKTCEWAEHPADMKTCRKCGVSAKWSSADCPICFGELMVITAQDIAETMPPRVGSDEWPCQQLHGGSGAAVMNETGLCSHSECAHPKWCAEVVGGCIKAKQGGVSESQREAAGTADENPDGQAENDQSPDAGATEKANG